MIRTYLWILDLFWTRIVDWQVFQGGSGIGLGHCQPKYGLGSVRLIPSPGHRVNLIWVADKHRLDRFSGQKCSRFECHQCLPVWAGSLWKYQQLGPVSYKEMDHCHCLPEVIESIVRIVSYLTRISGWCWRQFFVWTHDPRGWQTEIGRTQCICQGMASTGFPLEKLCRADHTRTRRSLSKPEININLLVNINANCHNKQLPSRNVEWGATTRIGASSNVAKVPLVSTLRNPVALWNRHW